MDASQRGLKSCSHVRGLKPICEGESWISPFLQSQKEVKVRPSALHCFYLYELYGKKPSLYFQWEIETYNSYEDGCKNYLVKSLKFVWGSLKDKGVFTK